jgi:hypothetical protein
MPYSIQKNDSNITTVIYTGSVGLNERKMAVDEVCGLVESSIPVRLLIDVRNIIMDMSTEDQVHFGKYVATREQFSEAKVAVVHNRENSPNILISTTAYLEGYRVVEFDDPNEAELWLLGSF